jgi:hypothetical protein
MLVDLWMWLSHTKLVSVPQAAPVIPRIAGAQQGLKGSGLEGWVSQHGISLARSWGPVESPAEWSNGSAGLCGGDLPGQLFFY